MKLLLNFILISSAFAQLLPGQKVDPQLKAMESKEEMLTIEVAEVEKIVQDKKDQNAERAAQLAYDNMIKYQNKGQRLTNSNSEISFDTAKHFFIDNILTKMYPDSDIRS